MIYYHSDPDIVMVIDLSFWWLCYIAECNDSDKFWIFPREHDNRSLVLTVEGTHFTDFSSFLGTGMETSKTWFGIYLSSLCIGKLVIYIVIRWTIKQSNILDIESMSISMLGCIMMYIYIYMNYECLIELHGSRTCY